MIPFPVQRRSWRPITSLNCEQCWRGPLGGPRQDFILNPFPKSHLLYLSEVMHSALDYYTVILIMSRIRILPLYDTFPNSQKRHVLLFLFSQIEMVSLPHCSQFSSLLSIIERLNYHQPSAMDSYSVNYILHYPRWLISVNSSPFFVACQCRVLQALLS